MYNAPKEGALSISFDCLKVRQPIGEYYIGSISSRDLVAISRFDVRRIVREEREVERWLGIQRPLNKKRVEELKSYVNTTDACFPTGVILAVEGRCASYAEDSGELTLRNIPDPDDDDDEPVLYGEIAKVLDGQHRIAGLEEYKGDDFYVNVCVFIDIDISDQAYIFSTVNLAQTKVNKSLVYDLYELADSRSPQKTCHNIAIGLDRLESSPFYKRIKRLGVATEGRFNETITQATIVQSLLKYISKDPMKDRDAYLRGKKLLHADNSDLKKYIFRNMFIDEKDLEINDIILNYYTAISEKWKGAWNNFAQGNMLNKTNGYRAFFRFLRPVYLHISTPGEVPSEKQFREFLGRIDIKDEEFNVDNYVPGSGGESKLYRDLMHLSGLDK